MNRKQLVAAAAFALLGTSAFAGGEFDPMTGFGPVGQSTVTRAEVRADTLRARATGDDLVEYDRGNEFAKVPASTVTREQVKAEFARARASDEIVEFDRGNTFAKAPASSLTREQVREETRLALRARSVRGS